MKKFKTILITVLTFAAVAGGFFLLYINRTVDTFDTANVEKRNISDAVISNENLNKAARGTQEVMDYGPVIQGSFQDDIVFVNKGFCSDVCPQGAFIVNYLMYMRKSSEDECKKVWGYDLNLVANGDRYCLFHIPEASCELVGGKPFYDPAFNGYNGCSTIDYSAK